MPSLEVLDALQAIIEKLRRLSDVERGDPLRSSDWNTLVDCIRRIASTLLDREVAGVVPHHDHPDQVSLDWLDPNLKQLLEKGPLNEPGALSRLGKLERDIKKLQQHCSDNRDQLSDVRGNVYSMSTAKVGQEGRLKNVELKLKNLPDARQDVFTLNQRVSGLNTKLDRTLAFEETLNVNGEPVNFAEIKDEVDKTRTLREGFTDQNGELMTADTIRRELANLQATLITQEDLELAFQRLETGGPSLNPQLEAMVATRVNQVVDEKLTDITTVTDPTFATRLKGLEETSSEQKESLSKLESRLDQVADLDSFEGLSQRVKTNEQTLSTQTAGQTSVLKSFAQLSEFLKSFAKPRIPGQAPRVLDVDTLRFNVAINNNEALREKLLASQINSVEKLAQLPATTLNSLMRDLVTPEEAKTIASNIKVLAPR